MAAKTTTIGPQEEGQKALTFKKGALHRQLHVPEGEKIPAAKREAARARKYGPEAKRRANFGFRGALATGRRTAARR